MQDVADAERQPECGLGLPGRHHRVPKRFLGQLRDVAMGLQGGARFVQTDVAILPEPENAQIDRAMALQLPSYSGAFPQRVRRFRIERDVALRRDRQRVEKPALEEMLAARGIARRHSQPLVELDDPQASEEIRLPPGFPNQLLIQPRR